MPPPPDANDHAFECEAYLRREEALHLLHLWLCYVVLKLMLMVVVVVSAVPCTCSSLCLASSSFAACRVPVRTVQSNSRESYRRPSKLPSAENHQTKTDPSLVASNMSAWISEAWLVPYQRPNGSLGKCPATKTLWSYENEAKNAQGLVWLACWFTRFHRINPSSMV